MLYLRAKDRKGLKTHTPYIGISNMMTSLHLCPWIFTQSMHQGPQTRSTPWYTFPSPQKAPQLFGESTDGFPTWLQLLKHTAKSFVPMSHHTPSPPWRDITLVTHRHQVPSTNPRGGLYSLPTHTHTGFPRGTLNAFFFQIYPVPHGFSLLRARNHRIIQKLKEGGGKKDPQTNTGICGWTCQIHLRSYITSTYNELFQKQNNNFVKWDKKRAPAFYIHFIARQSFSLTVL